MSKIATLLILLIAAATSSSSKASNSNIESKAEEDSSGAKSSLMIDKSSGKPNNKDWSFEEFENTMEVRSLYVMSRPNLFVRFYVHIYVQYLIKLLMTIFSPIKYDI